MIQEKAEQYFEKYPDLRVLFFFDVAGEFATEVDGLNSARFSLLKDAGTPFTTKCGLMELGSEDRVLFYLQQAKPVSQAELSAFPYLGWMMAHKVLELDDVGALMEEFQLPSSLRSLVAKYKSELQYVGVKQVVGPLLHPDLKEGRLQRGLMSCWLDLNRVESWSLIAARLMAYSLVGREEKWNRVEGKWTALGMKDAVQAQVGQALGDPGFELSLDGMRAAVQRVRYNALTMDLHVDENDRYAALKEREPIRLAAMQQTLVDGSRMGWSDDVTASLVAADEVIQGASLVSTYGVEAAFAAYSPSMVEAILTQVVEGLEGNPNRATQQCEQLARQSGLSDDLRSVIAFLAQVSKTRKAISEQGTYRLNTPEEYLEQYTASGYRVDQHYRRAIMAHRALSMAELPSALDLEAVLVGLESAYEDHVEQLNREWLACLDEKQFDYGQVSWPKQAAFYAEEIGEPEHKVAVIISDALRFEAAQELLSVLHIDEKNAAKMRSRLASLPSVTQVGMGLLLPGEKVWNDQGFLAKGKSTQGTPARDAILKSGVPDACAITYDKLQEKTRDERRAIFQSKVVYVYHNVIDAIGDKRNTERRTFDAVEDAVRELAELVKSVHATYNVRHVYVTADHGFLFNAQPLADADLQPLPNEIARVEESTRYFLTEDKVDTDLAYCIPVSMTMDVESSYWISIPKSVNRFRASGGRQFVHGGGSLQELVVPVIESQRGREAVSQGVGIEILQPDRLRVVSNTLRVNILQADVVDATHKAITITAGLYSDQGGELVSNVETHALDRTVEEPSGRMFQLNFNVTSGGQDHAFLKLKIFEEGDAMNPLKEQRVENKTLINPDF